MLSRRLRWGLAVVALLAAVAATAYFVPRTTGVDQLVAELESDDPAVQQAARRELGALKDEREIGRLVKCVARSPRANPAAIEVFREIGEPAAKPILDAARAEYAWLRMTRRLPRTLKPTAYVVVGTGQAELAAVGAPAVPAIMEVLKGGNAEMRWFVVQAMDAASVTGNQSQALITPLAAALKDPSDGVRGMAAIALGRFRATRPTDAMPRTVGGVAAAFPVEGLGEDAQGGVSAPEALSNARRDEVVAALVGALNDTVAGVRAYAAESLGKVGGSAARKALEEKLGEEKKALDANRPGASEAMVQALEKAIAAIDSTASDGSR